MHDDDPPLTDRQARAVIVAAEALGFEREPDLYEAWYDLDLQEDARYAAAYLSEREPDALGEALVADDPIPADRAARRITNTGRFTLGDAYLVIELASERGFEPPTADLPLTDWAATWDQAQAAVAFLWEHHPSILADRLGDAARIAPLPPTARHPGLYP